MSLELPTREGSGLLITERQLEKFPSFHILASSRPVVRSSDIIKQYACGILFKGCYKQRRALQVRRYSRLGWKPEKTWAVVLLRIPARHTSGARRAGKSILYILFGRTSRKLCQEP